MGMYDNSYWNAMDKESVLQYISPQYLGISSRHFEKQLPALQARLRLGAKNVELGFMGKGKGSIQGNITPGMHSKTEREEMRQLAKINEVSLTTHATANAIGYAGFSDRGFNEDKRVKDVIEVKRAIDFAADVAGGGAVVIHAGEFPRPVHRVPGKGIKGEDKFTAYADEEKHQVHYLVNRETGEIIKSVREDESIWEPVIEEVDGVKQYWEGHTYWDNIREKKMPIPKYKLDPNGRLEMKEVTYAQFKENYLNSLGAEKREKISDGMIAHEFLKEMTRADTEHDLGQAEEYENTYLEIKAIRDKVKIMFDKWKNFEANLSEAELAGERKKFEDAEYQKILRRAGITQDFGKGGIELQGKTHAEVLKETLLSLDKKLAYSGGVAATSRKRAERAARDVLRMESLDKYGLRKSAESVAELAMYAWKKEKALDDADKLQKPMFISPEAVFPEQYGSHPQELKKIVQASRERMVERLKKRGKSVAEAKTIAENHIKCTFDVGHINTWRKYFDGSAADFNKWLVGQAKQLQKEGIIGHVHLSDNFGYEDEHLASGEGNAPIKDFIKTIRAEGYKGPAIVEGGAQGRDREHEALMRTMKHLNSPFYTIEGGEPVGWAQIEQGYFDKSYSGVSSVMGAYAPDIDVPTEHRTWTLWSGVPFE